MWGEAGLDRIWRTYGVKLDAGGGERSPQLTHAIPGSFASMRNTQCLRCGKGIDGRALVGPRAIQCGKIVRGRPADRPDHRASMRLRSNGRGRDATGRKDAYFAYGLQ